MATLMEASMFIMLNMHVHVCMGCPPHTDTHPYPNPLTLIPKGNPGISKNSITLQPIEIIRFCLKI